jgi:hypothetical protein
VTSVSNGLVGAASGGAGRDMDPKGQRRIGDAAGGANPQDEERGVARLLDPFDGPGTRRPYNFLMGALRSLGDGPPAGGPSSEFTGRRGSCAGPVE